ncbi:MAG: DNA gyrase inhibitor YacG [Alphaproteobacteria bacterium]
MSGARALEPTSAAAGKKPQKGRARCLVCTRPMSRRFAPFCSRHCADIDLGRWLDGTYVIPGRERESAASDGDSDSD